MGPAWGPGVRFLEGLDSDGSRGAAAAGGRPAPVHGPAVAVAAAAAAAGAAPAGRAPPPPPEETITSTANAYVKHCVKLRERARYRRERGRLLLVGSTVLRELAAAGAPLRVDALLLQPGAPSPLPDGLAPRRVVRVSEAVAKKISGLETVAASDAIVELDVAAQGPLPVGALRAAFGLPAAAAAAAGEAPAHTAPPAQQQGDEEQRKQDEEQQQQQEQQGQQQGQQQRRAEAPAALRRLLVLEAVQDPGNLGTLLRCALAFGWDAVLLLPGCCDPFNEKALRASRGAALRLPLAEASWGELEALAADAGLALLAAEPEEEEGGGAEAGEAAGGAERAGPDARGGGPGRQRRQRQGDGGAAAAGAVARGGCVGLVLGSEGQGLSATALRRCRRVAVPMAPGRMESLNVSVAGGILMFMLSEGRGQLAARLDGMLAGSGGSSSDPSNG
ncbi:hypothetical protein Rsub_03132 [Raphidocelis subcapitata]|uniref:tRNA/rRNA methyltransferase SpoU type domain-containing protein n=1 Tax=Raphidocelis subcapitata TaxID=307507 RepID=A0A2V0NYA2_9CHLO|nr:hypothetical protein Rsub_03132 [Raphidocelis subcapitata]|eukprot:GBF90560.1 hypothetical protein Rsub_03132 [Raphidocelis subcapitata]